MNLRHTTRDIISQVEQRAGYPVEFVEGRAADAGWGAEGRTAGLACQPHSL